MKKLLSLTRYVTLVGVLSLLVAALAAFGWGVVVTVDAVGFVITHPFDEEVIVALVKVVDAFLVALALLIFGLGLYELTVGDLNLPEWMVIHNLHDLKAKLSGVLILVMAVRFLEELEAWENGGEMLFFALAIAVVSGALIAFNAFGGKD
jgi:uncharacterized membrane protein YqhA